MPGTATATFNAFNNEISAAAAASDAAANRAGDNIEDQIRVAIAHLRGLEILGYSSEQARNRAESRSAEVVRVLSEFAASILAGERKIATGSSNTEKAFRYLTSFLMSIASRTGTRDRLQIFTTNYDRIIEAGAEVAGLHLLDRFVGSLSPIFRSSRLETDMHYNPPGIRGEPRYLEGVAKITKLHGSLDWVEASGTIRRVGLPYGAEDTRPYLNAPGLKGQPPSNS